MDGHLFNQVTKMLNSPWRKAIVFLSAVVLIGGATESSAASRLGISELSNGKIYSVQAGTKVSITLHSTFWTLNSVSNLTGSETPTMTVIMPGPSAPSNCRLPGMGCGTVVWNFNAGKSGVASFRATRSSCGEALRCTALNSNFLVRFKVKP
jgi:hypothetical protein